MKRKLFILLTATLLFSSTLVGCSSPSNVVVNVENKENLNNIIIGKSALIEIDDGLYYDSTTRIVYWWNGLLNGSYSATTPSPYYAPNGLPYRYNPETNTLEEIKVGETYE